MPLGAVPGCVPTPGAPAPPRAASPRDAPSLAPRFSVAVARRPAPVPLVHVASAPRATILTPPGPGLRFCPCALNRFIRKRASRRRGQSLFGHPRRVPVWGFSQVRFMSASAFAAITWLGRGRRRFPPSAGSLSGRILQENIYIFRGNTNQGRRSLRRKRPFRDTQQTP